MSTQALIGTKLSYESFVYVGFTGLILPIASSYLIYEGFKSIGFKNLLRLYASKPIGKNNRIKEAQSNKEKKQTGLMSAESVVDFKEENNNIEKYTGYKQTVLTDSSYGNNLNFDISCFSDYASTDNKKIRALAEEQLVRIVETFAYYGIEIKDISCVAGSSLFDYEIRLDKVDVFGKKRAIIDQELSHVFKKPNIQILDTKEKSGGGNVHVLLPNTKRTIVGAKKIFSVAKSARKCILPIVMGEMMNGKPVVVDLAKCPHLIIAGATGQGKSVGINQLILSIMAYRRPDFVQFVLVDPKIVELSIYQKLPNYLLTGEHEGRFAINDAEKTQMMLDYLIGETIVDEKGNSTSVDNGLMAKRYQLLADNFVKNIEEYRALRSKKIKRGECVLSMPPMPYIVMVIDEFADLMMVSGNVLENAIIRFAQKGRAAGIHIILATQRPTTDIVTGIIKANMPARIAYRTTDAVNSRVILDSSIAKDLLGKGDAYVKGYYDNTTRFQTAFMTNEEVNHAIEDLAKIPSPDLSERIEVLDYLSKGDTEYVEDSVFSLQDNSPIKKTSNNAAGWYDQNFPMFLKNNKIAENQKYYFQGLNQKYVEHIGSDVSGAAFGNLLRKYANDNGYKYSTNRSGKNTYFQFQ